MPDLLDLLPEIRALALQHDIGPAARMAVLSATITARSRAEVGFVLSARPGGFFAVGRCDSPTVVRQRSGNGLELLRQVVAAGGALVPLPTTREATRGRLNRREATRRRLNRSIEAVTKVCPAFGNVLAAGLRVRLAGVSFEPRAAVRIDTA